MDTGELPPIVDRRYVRIRELGAGGMGHVALVEDRRTGGRVALKWVAAADPRTPAARRHRDEFAILSRLEHRSILRAYEFGRCDAPALQYFTAEAVDGPSLADLLERGPLSRGMRGWILRDILDALDHIHSHGWVHRDLKPQNVLLQPSLSGGVGRACLIDFGLALREYGVARERIQGTVHYLAPERICERALDRRSDLYALGVLLYQVFTGHLPFEARDRVDIVRAHLEDEPRPPTQLADLSPELESLVMALLRKAPGERPSSVEAVRAELRQCMPELSYAGARDARDDLNPDGTGLEEVSQRLAGAVFHRLGVGIEALDCWDDGGSTVLPLEPFAGRRPGIQWVRLRGQEVDRSHCMRILARRVRLASEPVIHVPRGGEPQLAIARHCAALLTACEGEQVLHAATALDSAGDLQQDEEEDSVHRVRLLEGLAAAVDGAGLAILIDDPAAEASIGGLIQHAADHARLAHALRRVAWITCRQEGVRLGDSLPGVLEATVGEFDPDGFERWLDSRLSGGTPPPGLADHILSRALGRLADSDLAVVDSEHAGELERAAGLWLFEPGGVRSPGEWRVEFLALESSARRPLEVLALLGGRCRADLLGELCSAPATEFETTVEELRASGWIRGERFLRLSTPSIALVVEHDRGELRWEALAARIQRLATDLPRHDIGRVARVHLARAAGAAPEELDSVARQLSLEALHEGAALEARALLEVWSRVPGVSPRRAAGIHDGLGDLCGRWGPLQSCVRHCHDAVRHAIEGGLSASTVATLTLKLSVSRLRAGEWAQGRALVERALAAGARRAEVKVLRRALLLLAEVAAVGGGGSVKEIRSFIDGPELSADPDHLARWTDLLREYHERAGDEQRAREVLGAALPRLERRRSSVASAWVSLLWGRARALEGAREEAAAAFRLAAFQFASCHRPRAQARALLAQAAVEGESGHEPPGRPSARSRARRTLERVGGVLEFAWLARLEGASDARRLVAQL